MRPVIHFIVPEGPQRGGATVYRPVLPRGVLQLARAAEVAGWDATVLDGYSAPHLLPTYLRTLSDRTRSAGDNLAVPNLVGISIHGPPAIEPALALAARLRLIEPKLPLVFGGQMANADAKLLLPLLPERSVLVAGDGESNIAQVMSQTLEASGEARLIRHLGIQPWQFLPDLNLLLPGYADYFAEEDFEYHLETQIGCPYRCFHCGTGRKGLYGKILNRPLADITEELDQLVSWIQQSGQPYPRLWITDETFGSDIDHATAFCEILISRKESWKWRAQSRADAISANLLARMRRAGCTRLAFGVEIPSDSGLDLLGKREEMKAIRGAFSLCHKHDVLPEAIIVVGTPGDQTRPEEFLAALDSLRAGSVQAYIYHPIPGSPWWNKYGSTLREPSVLLDRWSTLDFHSPPLDASPREQEQAIVAFLALELWRPGPERMPRTSLSMKAGLMRCPGCDRTVETVQLVKHRESGMDIFRYSVDGRTFYAAVTAEKMRLLEIDPTLHRNLFCGLLSVDPQSFASRPCPACFAVNVDSASDSVRFVAI